MNQTAYINYVRSLLNEIGQRFERLIGENAAMQAILNQSHPNWKQQMNQIMQQPAFRSQIQAAAQEVRTSFEQVAQQAALIELSQMPPEGESN